MMRQRLASKRGLLAICWAAMLAVAATSAQADWYDGGYREQCNACPRGEDVPNRSGCNFCNSPGDMFDRSHNYAFSEACARHDCCYHHGSATYGYVVPQSCQDDFYRDLLDACDRKYSLISIPISYPCMTCAFEWTCLCPACLPAWCEGLELVPNPMLDQCRADARTMYEAVSVWGAITAPFFRDGESTCWDYRNEGRCGPSAVPPTFWGFPVGVFLSNDEVTPVAVEAFVRSSQPLTYAWNSSCPGVFADPLARKTTWSPSAPLHGIVCEITVTADDGQSASVSPVGSVEFGNLCSLLGEPFVAEEISGIGPVDSTRCTMEHPCTGLQRGALLHLRVPQRAFAVAYLQDNGFFWNQEGSLLLNNAQEGWVGLWPGTNEIPCPSGKVYGLYIATSPTEIATSRDFQGLDSLAPGCISPPVYLKCP